jgi:hypothetical protein
VCEVYKVWEDGWAEGEGKGGVKGLSSRAEGRVLSSRAEGGVWV